MLSVYVFSVLGLLTNTDLLSGEATDIDEHDRMAAQQKVADEGIAANTVT